MTVTHGGGDLLLDWVVARAGEIRVEVHRHKDDSFIVSAISGHHFLHSC